MSNLVMVEPMSCEEFYESYAVEEIDDEIQHCYWSGGFDGKAIFQRLIQEAAREGITLTDEEDFDYDTFFWNVWINTEKGLS